MDLGRSVVSVGLGWTAAPVGQRRTAASVGQSRIVGAPGPGSLSAGCGEGTRMHRGNEKEGIPEEETDGKREFGAVRSQCL